MTEDVNSSSSEPSELAELVREAGRAFLIAPPVSDLLASIQSDIPDLPNPYDEIRSAFSSNLHGLLSTMAIPFEMAQASTLDLHFQRLSAAGRIQALIIEAEAEMEGTELTEPKDSIARAESDAAMREFLASSEGQKTVAEGTCGFLVRALARGNLAEAAGELLLQGIVLAWGAFEIVARDCLVCYLNARPEVVQSLRADSAAWKLLDVGKIPLELLAEYGFDLSQKMGNLVVSRQDKSDFRSIKTIYGALCPSAVELRKTLNSDDLRLLSLRRHLVVHQRGVVDDRYLSSSGDTSRKKGERLIISPKVLKRHVQTCILAGSEIIRTTADLQ